MPSPRYALAQPSSTEPDTTISQPPRCNPYDLRDAPRIHNDQVKVTSEEFQHHWSRGVPVVVTHVQLQGAWDPQYFVADPEHKKVKVTLVDCETGKTRQSTVADFFGSLGKPKGRTKIEKVKVRFSPLPGSLLLTGWDLSNRTGRRASPALRRFCQEPSMSSHGLSGWCSKLCIAFPP
jgi:hypothetical protein